MHVRTKVVVGTLTTAAVFTFVTLDWFASASAPTKPTEEKRPTVAQARSKAKLLHGIYTDTLDVIHRDYFREGGGRKVVPSRALEDVFSRQSRRTKIEARWLAVNLHPRVTNDSKFCFQRRFFSVGRLQSFNPQARTNARSASSPAAAG